MYSDNGSSYHLMAWLGVVLQIRSVLSSFQMYLMRYGYMDSNDNDSSSRSASLRILSENSIADSIRSFQRFAGLNETGVLDDETERMMSLPRCGVKDFVGAGATARRKKRYVLQGEPCMASCR